MNQLMNLNCILPLKTFDLLIPGVLLVILSIFSLSSEVSACKSNSSACGTVSNGLSMSDFSKHVSLSVRVFSTDRKATMFLPVSDSSEMEQHSEALPMKDSTCSFLFFSIFKYCNNFSSAFFFDLFSKSVM